MEKRLSLVTLGVADLDRAMRFYQHMGLDRHQGITDGVAFFQVGGMILALFPQEELAKDAGLDPADAGALPQPSSRMALGYNTRSEQEVDDMIALAERSGGRVVKPAQKAFWGGRSGYFADPDGHLWEVAHNPAFPIADDGTVQLPQ